jgi:chromosome segregation ATPase
MQISDWIAAAAALFSAVAAVVSALIAARWGKEFAQAKEAQIEAERAVVKEKETQLETLRLEIELLRDLTSPKMRESFVSMREQLEEYNDSLLHQLENAKATIADKEREISFLRNNQALSIEDVSRLKAELMAARDKQKAINEDLEEVQAERKLLDEEASALSDRQKEILRFIEEANRKNRAPTVQEIAKAIDVDSLPAIQLSLRSLERKGFVIYLSGRAKEDQRWVATARD